MGKDIQKQKKEKIVAHVLERSQDCLFRKTVGNAVHKNFLKDLRPLMIVNIKKMPSKIVDALEKEYCLVYKGTKYKQKETGL